LLADWLSLWLSDSGEYPHEIARDKNLPALARPLASHAS
jgi:hypothetical protein